jgi:MFS family permease
LVCDRIGRIWATRQLCLLWIVGIAIFMGNGGSLGAVYAGRFIAGLGVGQTVVVAPVYLAEIVSFLDVSMTLYNFYYQYMH